ncbi:uncharacterized protein LOC131301879 [Rhododendron vialii]|uniref:uncharacterized protein LOC131301879 n=1 Tax=Rhododendron vialii TaxID=182163 RepID=UPI0026603C68|nr:uncharacterized protein LOC131301879 [Rhododendron vialii]
MSESLLQAKTLNVVQVFLPSDVKDEIDKLNEDLNTAGCSRYAEPENKAKFWKNTESLQCNTMTCIYAFSLSCWSFSIHSWAQTCNYVRFLLVLNSITFPSYC